MPLPPHREIIGEADIAARIGTLAAEIAEDLPCRDPLIVGVLRGSLVFLADLARELARHDVDPEIELAWTSRYDGTNPRADGMRIILDVPRDVEGRAVLLIDDIVDTGETLRMLRDRLEAGHPSWLRTCVLLDKREGRKIDVAVDYRGFEAPDTWVFGYGLDLDGSGRALPYLAERA